MDILNEIIEARELSDDRLKEIRVICEEQTDTFFFNSDIQAYEIVLLIRRLAAAEQRAKFSHDNLMIVEKDRQAARDEILTLHKEHVEYVITLREQHQVDRKAIYNMGYTAGVEENS